MFVEPPAAIEFGNRIRELEAEEHEEVERILREQEERCRQTLRTHRRGLDAVAEALLERETLDGAEVRRLIDAAMAAEAPEPLQVGAD